MEYVNWDRENVYRGRYRKNARVEKLKKKYEIKGKGRER